MTDNARNIPHLRRNVAGGVIGNVMEWYDFAVFGYFAPVIGAQFFPSEDRLASIISAFGVFAAGYMMRPLGGVVFGHIGDRLGRKKALQLSVAMMALPTILLGFLPTHAQIGVIASGLLVLMRLLQGVSVGGELIGSVSFISEIAPPNRRGLYGSLSFFSAVGGIMLGSLVAAVLHGVLDERSIHVWGWRLPFVAGFIVAGFGVWMRKSMIETPDFERQRTSGEVEKSPVVQALKTMPLKVVHVGTLMMVIGGGFYMLFVWWPTYLTRIIHRPVPHALTVNTISMVVLMVLIPIMGLLSDVVGRRTILVGSTLGLLLFAYPLFLRTDHGIFGQALTCQVMLALLMSGGQGTIGATMVEMFPTRTRFSGIAVGYNLSLALFGGTAPLVSTWLVSVTKDVLSPAYYLMVMALVSLVAAVFAHPKGGMALERIDETR